MSEEIKIIKPTLEKLSIKHYKGTLDFPCDFCKANSYDNYHFMRWNNLLMVVCKKCLDKVIK